MRSETQYGGFAIYLSSTIAVLFVIFWAIIPQSKIENGILKEIYELLPQRYWILAVQCLILMTILFIYVGLLAYNVDVLTVPLDDPRTIFDTKGRLIQYSSEEEMKWYFFNETNGVVDLPINEVSRYLYSNENKKTREPEMLVQYRVT